MPRVSTRGPDIKGPSDLLEAARNRAGGLRARYLTDPVGLAERFGLKFPEKPVIIMRRLGLYDPDRHGPIVPGLRDLVIDVCLGEVDSAVALANRGGGKSQGVSFIEFFLVFIRDFDALNLGGSELQAQGVYNYIIGYIDHDKEFQNMLKGETKISETHTKRNAWVRVLTASHKSVRSPHAGGRKRDGRLAGGILVIDEEAEAAPDIVSAAMFTINTAVPSVTVRASTFHNAEGSFKEVVDNAEEMGYSTYQWDIFDVSEQCECNPRIGCQSEESCFREDHFEHVVDPVTGTPSQKLVHRAYCAGRSMYADGWIPPREIVKMWRRIKRNHAVWEVEAMGSRPSSKGFVIRDLRQFEKNLVPETGEELYITGWPISIGVDWGTRAAGVTVWQEQPDDVHALIYAEIVAEAGLTQIVSLLVELQRRYLGEFTEVAADIGGGGNYLNPYLRENYRVPCRDVNFAEEKEAAVAALNIFSESSSLRIPSEFDDYITEANNWKRKDGRIQKGNDHLMDAAICYFSKFIDRLGLSHVKIPPKAVSAAVGRTTGNHYTPSVRVAAGRVAVIRTLGDRPKKR